MYDPKLRKWISNWENEEIETNEYDQETKQRNADFLYASHLLCDIENKENIVKSVAILEALCDEEFPPALFAMGQLNYYGWSIAKNKKRGIEFYKKAAFKGFQPAKQALQKKRKNRMYIAFTLAFTVCLAVAVIGVIFSVIKSGIQLIKVNDQTTLTKVTTVQEFTKEISDLVSKYDDQLVISGKKSSNRIILKFEGKVLDLSDFLAYKVVARENNIVVIQFSNEEEAEKCLSELKTEKNIVFIEKDEYQTSLKIISEKYCSLKPIKSTEVTNNYYSWGVADMGLDQLSAYVNKKFSSNEILVAVIDNGALIHSENEHRYQKGYNVLTGGDVLPLDHGTHVSGTVLDGANCDNIIVKNYDVFNGKKKCSYVALYTAVNMAVADGADVINMSLGGPHSSLIDEAVDAAVDAGVVVVCSAGNETDNTANGLSCPADCTAAIVVGAYDINHNIAYFSNYGDSVDVCAPGVEIWSYSNEHDGSLVALQGTSMASPHVAAMAALLRAIYTDAKPIEIENYIKNSCRIFRNPSAYATGNYGAGAPDATIFIETF